MTTSRVSVRRRTAFALSVLAALTGMTAASAGAAEVQIMQPRGAVVSGSYVVTFKPGVDPAAETRDLVGRTGVKLTFAYTTALKGFAFRGSVKQAERIAADPQVRSVWADGVMKANVVTQPVPAPPNTFWGLDRIDQRTGVNQKYQYSSSASNVHAYVIDTGIRTSHSEFGGRASVGYDAIGDGRNGQDGNGHGTHVAGTIGGKTYGVAKSVKLVAVRVLDDSGSGSTSGVIAGVDWVAAHAKKPAVANMSLGGSYYAPLNLAVTNAVDKGVAMVVAAGTEGHDAGLNSPADTQQALTVGSVGNRYSSSNPVSDTRSDFSNYGSAVDLFAPGALIKSAWNTSNTATNTISGTSMASPHVAGAVAVYLSKHTSVSAEYAQQAVVRLATTGKVGDRKGSPNRLVYVPPRLPTRTQVDVTPEPVKAGGTVRVVGRISDATLDSKGVTGTVRVYFKKSGSTNWLLKGTTTTSTGFVFYQTKVWNSGTWKLTYAGNSSFAGSSATDAVAVS